MAPPAHTTISDALLNWKEMRRATEARVMLSAALFHRRNRDRPSFGDITLAAANPLTLLQSHVPDRKRRLFFGYCAGLPGFSGNANFTSNGAPRIK
jgi:hypothetical protein